MTIPARTDRMPKDRDDHLAPARVIAVALNAVPYEFWKHAITETSAPVLAVLKGLELDGFEIIRK
jgi:hypothetical protein